MDMTPQQQQAIRQIDTVQHQCKDYTHGALASGNPTAQLLNHQLTTVRNDIAMNKNPLTVKKDMETLNRMMRDDQHAQFQSNGVVAGVIRQITFLAAYEVREAGSVGPLYCLERQVGYLQSLRQLLRAEIDSIYSFCHIYRPPCLCVNLHRNGTVCGQCVENCCAKTAQLL